MQVGDERLPGIVHQRASNPDGKIEGEYDDNPLLNSHLYEVEFTDGSVREYSANLIAENILVQVDEDGYSLTTINAIIDHKQDPEIVVAKEDGFTTCQRGKRRLRKATIGWQCLVQWSDASETWVPLKDSKESRPVEMAEYARARGIENEPAFAWWVPYTL